MLRHGAASEDFHRGLRSLAEVQARGRWRTSASVRRYEKAGRLLAQVSRLSDDLKQQAALWEHRGLSSFLW